MDREKMAREKFEYWWTDNYSGIPMIPPGSSEYDNEYIEVAWQAWRTGNKRYEKVRRLNAREFADLYLQNISTGIPFDTLVDDLP